MDPASRAFDELRRHAQLMQILSEVSRAALEEDDLERLMHRVVDYIAERLEVAVASILLVDEEGERFVSEVFAGDLQLRLPEGEGWPLAVGVCGRCARTGEPQLVTDVASDPDYVPGHPEVRAEYITPIRYRGRILGVLNLESLRSDAFGHHDLAVFDAIAAQVAGSIHLTTVKRRLEDANRELARLSQLDGLTGVANRRSFDDTLDREWRRALRERRWISLLLADLDCFKTLNDTRGHLYGDSCLRHAADLLAGLTRRAGDLVARFGGEEFAILLPGATPVVAASLAEAARAGVEALGLAHGASAVSPVVTLSVGAASVCPEHPGPQRLVEAADEALYLAKSRGRNRVEITEVPAAPPGAAVP